MQTILQAYTQAKLSLGTAYGVTEDLLHVHAGLLIFFASALAFRRRMRSRVPISLVYFFALANEVVDHFSPGSAASSWEPLADIINTILWPTLLFFLARRRAKADDPDRVE